MRLNTNFDDTKFVFVNVFFVYFIYYFVLILSHERIRNQIRNSPSVTSLVSGTSHGYRPPTHWGHIAVLHTMPTYNYNFETNCRPPIDVPKEKFSCAHGMSAVERQTSLHTDKNLCCRPFPPVESVPIGGA